MSNQTETDFLPIVKKSLKERIDEFDSYSPEMRRTIREAPYDVFLHNPDTTLTEIELRLVLMHEALSLYGPNHPQARKFL